MLSNYPKQKVLDLITQLSEGELRAEVNRQVISEKSKFDPINLFDQISNDTDYITLQHLIALFQDNSYKVSYDDTQVILESFDKDQDQKWSFKEFLESVLPKDNQQLRNRIISAVKRLERGDGAIEYDIIYALIRIYDEELKCYKTCEQTRRELLLCDEFSIIAAFKEIDVESKGYINHQDLSVFIQKNGRTLKDSQIAAFIRRLDRDQDNILTYSEFMHGFYTSSNVKNEKPILGPNSFGSHQRVHSVSHKTNQQLLQQPGYSTPKKGIKSELASPAKGDNLSYFKTLRSTYTSPQKHELSTAHKTNAYTTPKKASDINESNEIFLSDSKLEDDLRMSIPQQQEYQTPVKRNLEDYSLIKKKTDSPAQSKAGRKTPLRKKDEYAFVMRLTQIIDHGKLLENLKNELALRKDFNLCDAFGIFDQRRNGQIDMKELQNGYASFLIDIQKEEVQLLMKRISSRQNTIITYQDFSTILTPHNVEFAKLLHPRKSLYIHHDQSPEQVFSTQTYALYRKFLSEVLKGEILCEEIRQDLTSRPSFSIMDAFKSLESGECGFVTTEDFKEKLEQYGVFASYQELQPLMVKYDRNYKGKSKITYEQFLRELSPRSVKPYFEL